MPNGTGANSYTVTFTSHTPDSYLNSKRMQRNYHPHANGKNRSPPLSVCRDLMNPGAHAETTTKRYGMSYRTAHSSHLCTINNVGGGEDQRAGGGIIERRKMLSHRPFAQKAAQFMLKTGLLG